MDKLTRLSISITVAAVAMCVLAGTASATTLTSPAGTTYTGTIKATAGTTELHGEAFSVSCASSTVEGKVESHGAGITIGGNIDSLVFASCNFPVTALKAGSLEVHEKQGGNGFVGTLTSTGAEITIHGPFGINCLYKTSATDIGNLTGSDTTKATAKLDIDSSLIPRTGDSAFCGANGEWTGSYTVNTPDYLDVEGQNWN